MAWGFESPRPHQNKGRSMNKQYHNKGLGWAFLIVTFFIVAVPWVSLMQWLDMMTMHVTVK